MIDSGMPGLYRYMLEGTLIGTLYSTLIIDNTAP